VFVVLHTSEVVNPALASTVPRARTTPEVAPLPDVEAVFTTTERAGTGVFAVSYSFEDGGKAILNVTDWVNIHRRYSSIRP